jgi:hypothetical protein
MMPLILESRINADEHGLFLIGLRPNSATGSDHQVEARSTESALSIRLHPRSSAVS